MSEEVPDLTMGPPGQRLGAATIRGVLWLGGDQIGRRVVDQVFTIFLARLLLPKDFGILALAAVFTALLHVFMNMGLSASIVQRRAVDDEYLSTAFWANVGAGTVLTGIAAVTGGLIGHWLHEPLVGLVLIVLSLRFLLFAAAATPMAIISRRMDYRVLALRSVLSTIFGGLVGVAMAYRGMGVWSLAGQEVATIASGTVLLYRATHWRPRLRFSWSKFLDMWAFGGRLQLSSLFTYLVRNTDNFLVGRYLGSTALGFYALGYAMFLAPLNDVGLLNRVMFSTLSRLQDDPARFRRAFLHATRYASMIALPMIVGLALVAPFVVGLLFGAKWLPAVPVVRLLTIAGFFQLMLTFGPVGLQAAGRPDMRLQLSIFSVLFYLPAFAVGVRWGIAGVAAGYLVASVLLVPILYRFIVRVMGLTLHELWKAVAAGVQASAVMMAAVLAAQWALATFLRLPDVVTLFLLAAEGAVVYVLVLWLAHRPAVQGLLHAMREAIPALGGRRWRGAEEG